MFLSIEFYVIAFYTVNGPFINDTYNFLVAGLVPVCFFLCMGLCAVSFNKTLDDIETMEEFSQRYELAGNFLLNKLEKDQLGPSSTIPAEPLRHNAQKLHALYTTARELKGEFEELVMDGLAAAACEHTPREIHTSLKPIRGAREKVTVLLKNDASRLTDILRGCVICDDDMSEICRCFAFLRHLDAQGVIEVLEIDNKYRDGATLSGYRFAKVVMKFRNFLVEVQILVRNFHDLIADSTPTYELVQSLNLVGAIPDRRNLLHNPISCCNAFYLR